MRKKFTLVLLSVAFISTLFTSCTKEEFVYPQYEKFQTTDGLDLPGDKHKTDHETRHDQLEAHGLTATKHD